MPPILDVDLDELPDSDTVPNGKYRLRIDNVSDVKLDKNENEFVGFEFTVVEGDHVNRKVFEPYVLLRAGATLKKICKAAGYSKPRLGATDDLLALELTAMVTTRESIDFGPQNKISNYIIPGESKMAGKGKK